MTECPICLISFEPESQINKVTTECGHTFHCSCLMKNVAHNGFGCPYCRNVMATAPTKNKDDDDGDDYSITSEEAREDDILTSFRWFHRYLDERLLPFNRSGVITYEPDVDEDGYFHEGPFDYWEGFKEGYMHPPYLFYKLSDEYLYNDDSSVCYSDLALAYFSLKRRCDGIIPLQETDHSYNNISGRCIPLYDDCIPYKNAETKVNKMVDKAIRDYYITGGGYTTDFHEPN